MPFTVFPLLSLVARGVILSLVINLCLAPFPRAANASFTVGDEKKVGEELLSMVRQHFEVLDDPDISDYINNLGQRVLKVAGPQYFNYHFFIIKNKEFNAFAAPSGLIFIHTGLLEKTENEGELLSVVAHEVGHVTSRHISDRIKKQKQATIGTAAMLIAGLIMGGGALTEAMVTGSMAAGASMSLKFSRQDEEESDRLAFKWMQELGVDPHAQATMLDKMHRVSIYSSANIPPYLLTHPEPKRRQGYVEDMIRMNGPRNYPKRDDFEFLRIRQRVMSKTKSPQKLKAMCNRNIRKGGLPEAELVMAHYGLAQAYLEDADYDRAQKELEYVIEHFPGKLILQTDLAVILRNAGKEGDALEILKKIRAARPDDDYTAFQLGLTYQQLGYNDKAVAVYRRLLRSHPDYAQLHYNLGGILMNEPAEKGNGHFHMGRYFWLTGNRKSANYHFNSALADPTTSSANKDEIRGFRKKMAELEKG